MTNRINVNQKDWISQAVKMLTAGEIVIYPTETSYGLGVDATNAAAVAKLLDYKGGRLNKAISVAVADEAMARGYVELNPMGANVFRTLMPGPVTLVAKSKGKVAAKVESERQTLGIRYSSQPLVSQLVAALGRPVTATSANTSGMKQIYSFADWQKYVSPHRQEMVSIFIDAGELPVRPPSTIIDTTLNNPAVLRQGEVVFDQSVTVTKSNSVEDTVEFGQEFVGKHLDLLQAKPVILALEGDLGAGKTHLAKGVALGLNIKETITSPTYIIMREYDYQTVKGSGKLYHIDAWRLFDDEGMAELGLESKLIPGTVVVIEWQQKINLWLTKLDNVAIAYIKLEQTAENERKIAVKWA